MELLQQLIVTAFVALLASFLLAKLVSFAMAAHPNTHHRQHVIGVEEDVIHLHEQLQVQGFISETRADELVADSGGFEETVMSQNETADSGMPGELREERLPVVIDAKNNEEKKEREIEFQEDKDVKFDDSLVQNLDDEVITKESSEIETEDDDDWEGIERSELEKVFAEAVNIVESGDIDANLTSKVQMELYGLHKIATEGPCRHQSPLPLKLSARAKWNAWQRLGNMSPEMAMEQYIALVSDGVPGWMEDKSTGDGRPESSVPAIPRAPVRITLTSHQPNITSDSNPEMNLGADKDDKTERSGLENKVKE
ncbi:hypothetical protein K2173_028451 [Erythroxylum novogranatense]|uniref:ACB domain-containing protein n=1 Tax=Erythroxylum novogranatense TaxID=1862640 RepID=A0AAV8U4X4_9ROSI|nr:hypothetical protein K2173_028451 [Erythroxylum novogranatense]